MAEEVLALRERLLFQAICPVCLDLFTQPVLTACGHSFCQQCLAAVLGNPPRPAACPQCRAPVEPGSLRPNRSLGDVAEVVRSLGEVAERLRCPQHDKLLALFCEPCAALVCALCRDGPEHRRHRVRPAEEAARELRETLQRNLHFLQEKKERLKCTLPDQETEALVRMVVEAMLRMGNTIEKLQECMEQQKKILLDQVLHMFKELIDKSKEYKSRVSERQLLLDTVIAQIQEKRDQPAVEFLMDVGTILSSCEAAKAPIPKPVSLELQSSVEQLLNKSQMFLRMEDRFKVKLLSEINSGKREKVTLDSLTANVDPILSDDNKTIEFRRGKQTPPDTSKRFTRCPSVLGSQGFTSGRHYWDVEVRKEGFWVVGMALKSVTKEQFFNLLRDDKICDFRGDWNGPYIPACHDPSHVLFREKLQRIRVCLDCDVGRVTFCNAEDMKQILQFEATFTDKVFPYFRLWSQGAAIRVCD